MMQWFLVFVVVLAGTMVPLQAGVNSQLAKYLTHPLQAAFISFFGGTVAMALGCWMAGTSLPLSPRFLQVPLHLWIGGLLGAVMVMTSIILAPRLGATVLISSSIAGQLVASLFLDHYGWMGFVSHPISFWRIVGIFFLAVGVVLVRFF